MDIAAREAFLGFLFGQGRDEGMSFIRAVVVRLLYGRKPKKRWIDQELVAELAEHAWDRAARANAPPDGVAGIRRWVAVVTLRAAGDRLDERKRFDLGLDGSELLDAHVPDTDWLARAYLLDKWLDRWLGGDETLNETFDLMARNVHDGFTLEELAAELGGEVTANALALRFHKLRKKLSGKLATLDRISGEVQLVALPLESDEWQASDSTHLEEK